jgi:hypothetical protein
MPAVAQTNAFSVGLAFLDNNGGVGVNADYSRATRTRSNGQSIGWVGDVSFNHKGISDVGYNTFFVDGGVRLSGKAGDKATWHVQGTAGIAHSSFGVDTLTQSICDSVGFDCDASDTGFLIMPGGALTYWFSDKSGVKGQLNIPILLSGNTGSGVRFDINYVMKLSR